MVRRVVNGGEMAKMAFKFIKRNWGKALPVSAQQRKYERSGKIKKISAWGILSLGDILKDVLKKADI